MNGPNCPGGSCKLKLLRFLPTTWKKVLKRNPMGGRPGMVPGQMVCGQRSFCAGDPNMTGGILMKLSSSFGNLKPASLNAFPKSFSLGKSTWHVAHEVPYCRANAGIARADGTAHKKTTMEQHTAMCDLIKVAIISYEVFLLSSDLLAYLAVSPPALGLDEQFDRRTECDPRGRL